MGSTGKKQRRRDALLRMIEAKGYLSLSEATKDLDVSEQTIRRDFSALDSLPNIRRTHGGLTLIGSIAKGEYSKRQLSASDEKQVLARRVADYIADGASVFLDNGTTAEVVAEALLSRNDLNVMTYSIRVASRFLNREDITVAIPGGIVRHEDGAIVGPHEDGFMEQFRFDYAIVTVGGADRHGRLANNDMFEVKREQAAMRQAEKTILILTSDKIGQKALVELCHLKDIDLLAISEEGQENYAETLDKIDVTVL